MAQTKIAQTVNYYTSVTSVRLAEAAELEASAWIEFASFIVETFGRNARGQAVKIAEALYAEGSPCRPAMAQTSFVNRINEAVRLLAKFGGSVRELSAAVDEKNAERVDAGKRPLVSVQTLAREIAPAKPAAKAPTAPAADVWSPDDFTTGKVRQALLSAGVPNGAIGAILSMLAKGVKISAEAAAA